MATAGKPTTFGCLTGIHEQRHRLLMKYSFLLLTFGILFVLAACQKDSEPQPAALTAADSLRLQLTGSWQSNLVSRNYYTNDELADQQSSASIETYNFTKEGDFQLIQDVFSIKGKWSLNKAGTQLVVATESGEVMQWQIRTLSDEQLLLYSSQTVMVGENAQRLETLVDCSKVLP